MYKFLMVVLLLTSLTVNAQDKSSIARIIDKVAVDTVSSVNYLAASNILKICGEDELSNKLKHAWFEFAVKKYAVFLDKDDENLDFIYALNTYMMAYTIGFSTAKATFHEEVEHLLEKKSYYCISTMNSAYKTLSK